MTVTDNIDQEVRRHLKTNPDSVTFSDATELFSVKARMLLDALDVIDDVIVSRSAILNSSVISDSINLSDFMFDEFESGNLPADICIKHEIENQ